MAHLNTPSRSSKCDDCAIIILNSTARLPIGSSRLVLLNLLLSSERGAAVQSAMSRGEFFGEEGVLGLGTEDSNDQSYIAHSVSSVELVFIPRKDFHDSVQVVTQRCDNVLSSPADLTDLTAVWRSGVANSNRTALTISSVCGQEHPELAQSLARYVYDRHQGEQAHDHALQSGEAVESTADQNGEAVVEMKVHSNPLAPPNPPAPSPKSPSSLVRHILNNLCLAA